MVEYTIDLRFRGFEIVENRWISENCYHRSDQQFVLGDEGFESTNRIYVWTIEGQRNFFKCLSVLDSGNIYVYLSSNLGDFEAHRSLDEVTVCFVHFTSRKRSLTWMRPERLGTGGQQDA